MFLQDFDAELLTKTPSPYAGDFAAFLRYSKLLSGYFSTATRDALARLGAGRLKYHQFTEIPVSEWIPPTETGYTARIPKPTFQSEGIIGAASLELGHLFGYEETGSCVMYDIYPVKGHEESRSFVNSRKMLSFHSDGSAHPALSPDYVLLYCIRSDPAAINLVADLDVLLAELPDKVVGILQQPLFQHLVSQSPECYQLKPVLFPEEMGLAVRYDEETVVAVNDAASHAQSVLADRLRKVAVEVANSANSLLIMNNKRCLHARTSFAPRFDGRDRWIKGAFVTTSNIRDGSILRLSLDGTGNRARSGDQPERGTE